MNNTRHIVCGSIAIDRVMNFGGSYKDVIRPDKIHILSLSVLLDHMDDTHGGTGGNIAYSLALLGEKPVLLGAVGGDAKEYMQRLAGLGVDTSKVHVSKLKTASFTVMTDKDDNQVGGFYPGAMSDSAGLTLKSWQGQDVLVTVSAHDPDAMRRQVEECREYGLRLFYDVSQQIANISAEDIKAALAVAELLVVNDYELSMLCDKIHTSPEALVTSVPVVVTTRGKEGTVVAGSKAKGRIEVPTVALTEVVDPTGAGDAFRSGFLYGYVRGWELEECARLGNVTASFSVEKHGTQSHTFTKHDIMKRYTETFGSQISL